MTESKHIWGPLKDNSPLSIHWNRIENTAGTGMADLNGCHDGVEVWIENKIFIGNQLHFRPTQPDWLKKRRRAGGHVFVLARKKDTFYLYDAARVDQIIAEGIKTPALATFSKTGNSWNWRDLFHAIFGHHVY